MSAISPPAERIWWKQPIDKLEFTWIAIAFVWSLVMFVMMVYWHVAGNQNLSNETYKTTKEMFAAKAQAVVDKYTVRAGTAAEKEFPVVAARPPARTST
jgi:cytochrome c oxidase subunit 2